MCNGACVSSGSDSAGGPQMPTVRCDWKGALVMRAIWTGTHARGGIARYRLPGAQWLFLKGRWTRGRVPGVCLAVGGDGLGTWVGKWAKCARDKPDDVELNSGIAVGEARGRPGRRSRWRAVAGCGLHARVRRYLLG